METRSASLGRSDPEILSQKETLLRQKKKPLGKRNSRKSELARSSEKDRVRARETKTQEMEKPRTNEVLHR